MIIKARWIIKKDNKIFLASWIKTWIFYLPGWTLENWETIKECLTRELIEELWVTPVIWELLTIQEIKTSPDRIVLDFWFEILNSDDFENIDKSKATHSYEWIEAWFYDLSKMESWKYLPIDLLERLETKKEVWIFMV